MNEEQSQPKVAFDRVAPPVLMLIDRENLELGNLEPVLSALLVMTRNAEAVREFAGRVELVFDGYDADPRGLHLIPEVRSFVQRLHDQFPWWFHFSSKVDSSLWVVMRCLMPLPVTETLDGRTYERISPEAWNQTTMSLFTSMNELYAQHGLSAEENSLTTRQVIQYTQGFMVSTDDDKRRVGPR